MTDEMPRPSGQQPPGPVPPGPVPPGPMMPGPVSPGPMLPAPMLPTPMLSYERTPMPGANGLAIAALCCGLVGLFPIAAIVAIVLGIVALSQLQRRIQRGRGMAIAGIVLGSLWIVGWIAFVIAVPNDEPARDPAGQVATQTADIYTLRAGDCFDIPDPDPQYLDDVRVKQCSGPHQAQVGAIVTLPEGDYPGEDKVVELTDKKCGDTLEPLMRDKAFAELDLSFVYPDSSFAWRMDRSAICILEGRTGATTGSALK